MTRKRAAILCFLAGLAALVATANLSSVSVAGGPDGTTAYRHGRAGVWGLATAATSMVGAAGVFITSKGRAAKAVALLAIAFALILSGVAYRTATDQLTVGPTHATLPGAGFPVSSRERVAYADLEVARWVSQPPTRTRFGSSEPPRFDLALVRRDGSWVEVPVGDLLRAARAELVRRLEEHRVPSVSVDRPGGEADVPGP